MSQRGDEWTASYPKLGPHDCHDAHSGVWEDGRLSEVGSALVQSSSIASSLQVNCRAWFELFDRLDTTCWARR